MSEAINTEDNHKGQEVSAEQRLEAAGIVWRMLGVMAVGCPNNDNEIIGLARVEWGVLAARSGESAGDPGGLG